MPNCPKKITKPNCFFVIFFSLSIFIEFCNSLSSPARLPPDCRLPGEWSLQIWQEGHGRQPGNLAQTGCGFGVGSLIRFIRCWTFSYPILERRRTVLLLLLLCHAPRTPPWILKRGGLESSG